MVISIAAGIFGMAKIAGGIIVGRAVGKGINAIGERVFPYDKTRTHKQVEHSAAHQRELELLRESFQTRLQQENINAQERIAVFNRHSSMLLAEKNAHLSLRHTLVQDAIRNFPLNISPLVLLENNHIDISFLLGEKNTDDSPDGLDNIFKNIGTTKPLNVFITPMHIDTRVNGKEVLASQIYDSVYSNLESIFVNEYSRNSERPVIFYSAAWNKNVKAGLHAADELYYFLKEMPTIVIEPRFDGKTIKLMFSCWGIGYSSQIHCRQEMAIPLDLNSMIALSVYDRSKRALESFATISSEEKVLRDQRSMFEHNVSIFKQLNLEKRIEKRLNELADSGKSSELDELGDYCKLLYFNQSDVIGIADIISATTGMMIAVIADTHHLLANDTTPKFPQIYKKYFGDYVNQNLLKDFGDTYTRTYLKLIQEFPEQESRRLIEKESTLKLLGIDNLHAQEAIRISLIQKCCTLGTTKEIVNDWTVPQLIDHYIKNLDDDYHFQKSLIPFMSAEQKIQLSSNQLRNNPWHI